MQNLNSDCLLEIFKNCTLREQLILTRVCETFRTVIVDVIWRRQLRKINIIELSNKHFLTNKDFQEILLLNAKHLEELTLVDECQRGMYYYSKSDFWWSEDLFDFTYPKLKYFKCIHPFLDERHIKAMADKCKQLESLQLGSNYLTGSHIKLFKNLTTLHVGKCALIIEHLTEIMTNLNLKHLTITANKFNMNDLPAKIIEWMLNLEHLTLIEHDLTSVLVRAMKKGYNLKFLHINDLYSFNLSNKNWLNFFETCGTNIQVLKLLDSVDVILPYTIITNIFKKYYKYLKNLQILCINGKRIFETKFDLLYSFLATNYITFFYNFFDLIHYCTKLEHIYLTAVDVSDSKFKLWILDIIESLSESKTSRKTLTIHLQRCDVKDNSKIEDITESKIYTQQSIVKFAVDYREGQITNQKSQLEFEFY